MKKNLSLLPLGCFAFFLDLLALNYGAAMRIVDFENDTEPSRLAINGWVSDQTQEKIKDLLPPGSITALTRLVLTNAIYFKASWRFPFNERLTQEAPFRWLDGGQVTVPMMSLDSEFGYARGEGFQALELLYHGEKFSMVILLPDEGKFAAFESALEAGRLNAILGSLQPERLQLRFPKFSFEFNLPLKTILIQLGMADAFSETAADFSGIDGTRRLFIHDVLHKAFVAVNEAGTEAAAATAVIIGVVSVPPEVIVDRPFLFLIRERESGAILFLGRVVRP